MALLVDAKTSSHDNIVTTYQYKQLEGRAHLPVGQEKS